MFSVHDLILQRYHLRRKSFSSGILKVKESKMQIWVFCVLLACVFADEYKDESNNINDVRNFYEVDDVEGRPIFPFDVFNLGYDHFLRRFRPPFISAMNSDIYVTPESSVLVESESSTSESVSESSSSTIQSDSRSKSSSAGQTGSSATSDSTVTDSLSTTSSSRSSDEKASTSEMNIKASDSASIDIEVVESAKDEKDQSTDETSTEKNTEVVSSTPSSEQKKQSEESSSQHSDFEKETEGSASRGEVEMATSDFVAVEEFKGGDFLAPPSCRDRLSTEDIREEIRTAYKSLDELRKRVLKSNNAMEDLTMILDNLERLCDEICTILPREYLVL